MKKELVYLKIAGFVIQIRFFLTDENLSYEEGFIDKVKDYYQAFLLNKKQLKSDYIVEVVYEHSFRVIINKSKKDTFIHFYKQLNKKRIRTFYHLSGSQLQILIRKITHDLLVEAKGFILHASASRVRRSAVLFLGESGAGKSTTMKILSSKFHPLGDDSIIIKKEKTSFYCYCSSAHERNDWFFKSYEKNKLRAICFIKKSDKTSKVKIISKQEAIRMMGKQMFSEKEDVSKQMENLVYFVQGFNHFYNLEISLNQKEELMKLMEKF